MKEAGIGFVRLDFLWQDIEQEKNKFNFDKYDRIIKLLLENNINVLGILGYNVSSSRQDWNKAPDRELFTRYAKETVSHFKNRIKYWEIWNEPDNKVYWQPQDGLKEYSSLLKQVYKELKTQDPSSSVLMGSLSADAGLGLRQLYENGAREYFDIVNIHPFVNPLIPDALGILHNIYKQVYEVMEQFCDAGKEIWFTEIGCPGINSGLEEIKWWLGKCPSEEEQAEWVRSVYSEPLKWQGVKKIFWAFFRDTPNHWGDGIDYFGLVRQDFSKKPAFAAYRNLTKNYRYGKS